MMSYSYFEKWAAIPWLNQNTSQTLAPFVEPSMDIRKMLEEEKAKERRKKLLRTLLGVGIVGGGVVGGSALLDAHRARQAALARKIMGKNILRGLGKGVGGLGILAALGFGAKHLADKITPHDSGDGFSLNIANLLSRPDSEPTGSRVSNLLGEGRRRANEARERQGRQRNTIINQRINQLALDPLDSGGSLSQHTRNALFNLFFPGSSLLGARSSY